MKGALHICYSMLGHRDELKEESSSAESDAYDSEIEVGSTAEMPVEIQCETIY